MRKRLPTPLLLVLPLVLAALPARGESAAAPPPPSKADLIRRLMAVSGSGELGEQLMTQLTDNFRQSMPQVPAEFWDELVKEIDVGEIVELIVPVYERHFSEQDIRELIAFYETPIGRKLVSALPQITAESMAAGMEWGQKVAERIVERLKAKGYQPTA